MNHYRERKTGPCFPLAIMRCRTHTKYFTLYPFGHVPYGREAIAGNISPCGNPVVDDQRSDPNSTSRTENATFQGTIFDAAHDVVNNKVWPKEGVNGSLQSRFTTMLQKLDRGSRLLGVHKDLTIKEWEAIGEIANIPGQILIDGRHLLKDHPSFRKKGEVIVSLLHYLPQTSLLYERFLEIGATQGLWPTPHFWDHKQKRLKWSSFRRIGIRGSPTHFSD